MYIIWTCRVIYDDPAKIGLHFGEHNVQGVWEASQFTLRPAQIILHPQSTTEQGMIKIYNYDNGVSSQTIWFQDLELQWNIWQVISPKLSSVKVTLPCQI